MPSALIAAGGGPIHEGRHAVVIDAPSPLADLLAAARPFTAAPLAGGLADEDCVRAVLRPFGASIGRAVLWQDQTGAYHAFFRDGQPLGLIPGAVTYGIAVQAVGARATWGAFRTQIVAFMQGNAISSPADVRVAFPPAIWAELDSLQAGDASPMWEWDRLVKNVGTPAISSIIPAETAILTATVQGIAPGYLGLYGGVDLIRDPFTKAASGQLVLTGLVTADFTVPRGAQTRILNDMAAP